MISSLRNRIEKRKEKQALLEVGLEKLQLSEDEKLRIKEVTKDQVITGYEVKQVATVTDNKNEATIEACGRFADEPEYRMNHARRGTALIINNKVSRILLNCTQIFIKLSVDLSHVLG